MLGAPAHRQLGFSSPTFCQWIWRSGLRGGSGARAQSQSQCGGFIRVYSVAASAKEKKKQQARYSFHAEPGVSWISLGLSGEISQAAMKAGFDRPSTIQGAAIPRILEGGDVILAAETGSGKTHAYLLPIFQLLAKSNQEFKEKKAEDENAYIPRSFALVLCPNATLCQQAAEMATKVCSKLGDFVRVAVITGGQGWPTSPPDFVFATPGALINHLFSFDPKQKRRTAFLRDARYVVFDEADMLLSGGFERQVIQRLIPLLRLAEKKLAAEEKAIQKPGSEQKKEETKPWTDFEPSKEEEFESDGDSDMEKEIASEWKEAAADIDSETATDCTPGPTESGGDEKGDDTTKKKRKTYRKKYKRSKQYIFVAATLPVVGKKTPAIMLSYQFPDATWVNGDFLHRQIPSVKHQWIEVDSKKRVEALLKAIAARPEVNEAGTPPSFMRTMVFANTIESVTAISKILEKVNIVPLCYHRDIPLEERTSNLKRFQDEGGILLCTDSGARGLDIRDIGHIVQAEFALNAVDYLHRVGRTGRAGNTGVVTSLYTESSKPLANAVRIAISDGQPVEGAFSRKRSFRNKLKKKELQQDQSKESSCEESPTPL
ncbi:DEAD-box ATP-dependent RNA helicase 22 [Selaginella moellendorffii]|uniref:DEAD-box ATP-dependent RNA helicase 22 n=1 Tax=Selaginella moellendorffii TaxID=88036 RepID=UPI000D1CB60B|nr:DEAD-box ATP-dependent RNA helicase 22 [Selaginella moellendorffii]|eukprot:XP_024528467.1 DEAD-box ATP-dependent RNA helicase 22 [Selaginella moellendorffii]